MEKTTLGSDLPECKHEFGLPAEAEPHSLMNQRSSIEQSAFGPQSLILKEEGQGKDPLLPFLNISLFRDSNAEYIRSKMSESTF